MFKCKICSAKDELIAQLRSEVAYLRQLAVPQNDPLLIPAYTREAESIMGGHEEFVDQTQSSSSNSQSLTVSELDAIVGGTYGD